MANSKRTCLFCQFYSGKTTPNGIRRECTIHDKTLTREEARHHTCSDFEDYG